MPDYNPLEKKKDKDEKNDGKESKKATSESTDDLHQWINELIRAFRESGK